MKLRRFVSIVMLLMMVCTSVQADQWGAALAKGVLTYFLNEPTKKSVSLAGDSLALEYRRKYRTYHDPELTEILKDVVARAREKDPSIEMPDIMGIDMKDSQGKAEVSAFAIPGSGGGHIFVVEGLKSLAKKKSSDYRSALSGIIGHELGHLALGHAQKSWKSALTGQVVVETVLEGSGASKNLAGAVRLMEFVREQKYSQKDETHADQFAWDNYPARYSRKAFPEFFGILKAEAGDTPRALKFLSSHPLLEDRQKLYEKKLDEEPPNYDLGGPVSQQASSSNPSRPPIRLIFNVKGASGQLPTGGQDQVVAWINQGLIGSEITVVPRGQEYQQAREEQRLEGVDPDTRVESGKFYGATGLANIILSCTTGERDYSMRARMRGLSVSQGKRWFFASTNGTITSISIKTLDVRDVVESDFDEVQLTGSRTDVSARLPGRRGQDIDVSVDRGGDYRQIAINNAWRSLASRLATGLRANIDRLPRQESSRVASEPVSTTYTESTVIASSSSSRTESPSYIVFAGGSSVKRAKIGQVFSVYSWKDSMVDRDDRLISRGRQLGVVRVVGFNSSRQVAEMSGVVWNEKYKDHPIGVWIRSWSGDERDIKAGLIFVPL